MELNLEELLKLDDMEVLFEGNSLAKDNDDLNKSVEEQIASLKSEIRSIDENIDELQNELETDEYYKSAAGAADCEMTWQTIDTLKDVVEELRNELNELITNALEKGEIKGDFESWAGINTVYINSHQVRCTGYQNRPEITQELLDKMIKQRLEPDMEKHMDFQNCYFSGIKLEGTFEGVNFSDCYFSNCKFENAQFKDCNFANATFSDVEVRSVSFQNTGFEKADLWSSKFENTQFKEVDFSGSNWKSIAAVKDTVSFENCDFTITSMNSVYIQGSKISGEMKNIDTISVTLGGATRQEIENHERMIKDTLGSNNARGKEIGRKESLGTERNMKKKSDQVSASMSSRKTEARRRRGKSR